MNGNFYISKVGIVDENGKSSEIAFDSGCNIICGPSNTGKSLIISCIDYGFGSKTFHHTKNRDTNIATVNMELTLNNGTIVNISRQVDGKGNKVIVRVGDDDEVNEYSLETYKKYILCLIGIENDVKIISGKDYKRQSLTFRTFVDLSIIDEERMISKDSIFYQGNVMSRTAILSSIYYLVTGKEQVGADIENIKALKERQALTESIVSKLSEKIKLSEDDDNDILAIENKIIELQEKIEGFNKKQKSLNVDITTLHEKNRELNQILDQYQYRLDRYYELADDYKTDLCRADFIIDGESKLDGRYADRKCPLCNNPVEDHVYRSYSKIAKNEKKALKEKLYDLDEVIAELITEIQELEDKIEKTDIKIQKIEIEYNENSLEIANVYTILNEYYHKKALYHTVKSVEECLSDIVKDEDREIPKEYSIKKELKPLFTNQFAIYLKEMLSDCNYPSYNGTEFDESLFDIIVNSQSKASQGKGYRAYLNSVVAFSYLKYMSEKAKYHVPFLILDSPLLSLKEIDEGSSTTMKIGLLSYIIKHQYINQVIIIENELPEIDYSKVNVISFSGMQSEGREGFIEK